MNSGDAVVNIAHVIQVALTPVFLLSGIGTLLNLFNTRLSRVSDHTKRASELLEAETLAAKQAVLRAHLGRLQRRRAMLDASVVLGAVGCAATLRGRLRSVPRRIACRPGMASMRKGPGLRMITSELSQIAIYGLECCHVIAMIHGRNLTV